MPETKTTKSCFVIAPIGEEGSETRNNSDQILRHIIRPTAELLGYSAMRADEIADSGLITPEVIQHLLDDDLVIADLTGHNPNVFYELAIRHAIKRPIVQMISTGQSLPFDIANSRIIDFDISDLDSVESCKDDLAAQIRATEGSQGSLDGSFYCEFG